MDTVFGEDLDSLGEELMESYAHDEHELDQDLLVVVRDHVCPRCHHDTDEDGYCAMCGATYGRV